MHFGFLNAGTPLEIASTPVSAAQPEENVAHHQEREREAGERLLRRRRASRRSSAAAFSVSPRTKIRKSPQPTMHSTPIMNAYVGIGERDARLADTAQVHRGEDRDHHDRDLDRVLAGEAPGRAEVRTPEETDTATVST